MDFSSYGKMINDAVAEAVKAERLRLHRELARALGFNGNPESMYLGTWENLIAIVYREHERLVNVRRALG